VSEYIVMYMTVLSSLIYLVQSVLILAKYEFVLVEKENYWVEHVYVCIFQ